MATDYPTWLKELTPHQIYDLIIASLEVATSISQANYRTLRQPKRITDPTIRRAKLVELIDALDKLSPGIVDRTYEIKARS